MVYPVNECLNICRFADAEAAGAALADRVASLLDHAIAHRGAACLAVPGGRSPGPFFAALFARPLDWSRVTVVLTDERWVDANATTSNEAMLRRHLSGTPDARVVGLKTAAPSPADAAADLATYLGQVLPPLFDAVVLGMGDDGHIASLFPGQPLSADGAACLPGVAPSPPRVRMSLSLERLLASRALFLLCGGADKLRHLTEAGALPVHHVVANIGAVYYFEALEFRMNAG